MRLSDSKNMWRAAIGGDRGDGGWSGRVCLGYLSLRDDGAYIRKIRMSRTATILKDGY